MLLRKQKIYWIGVVIVSLIAILAVGACDGVDPGDTTAPTVLSVNPAGGATDVAIDTEITTAFSEAMDAATFTAATFWLKRGTTAVTAALSYADVTATAVPADDLEAGTQYTAGITSGASDSSGNRLAADYGWTFTTADAVAVAVAVDTTAPAVSSTTPEDSATNVAVTADITASFSEEMAPATITTTTFALTRGVTPVAGAVSYTGTTATFNPTGDLDGETEYTATVTTGAEDLAGNPGAVNVAWSFTTADIVAPTVLSTLPADSAADVLVSGNLTATFSEAMNPATIDTATFTLSSSSGAVAGTATYAGVSATFEPEANLAYSTEYTASITTGVTDLAGNAPVSVTSWTFTTIVAPDVTGPAVVGVSPTDTASDIQTSVTPTATFSEAVASATISGTSSAFTLEETSGAVPVAGTATLDGLTATFTPASVLVSGTGYTARISTTLQDIAGNPMAAEYSWSFTTAGMRPVMLRSAGDFVILATTGVTVGATATIDGRIGIDTLDTSFVGFAQVMDVSGTFSRAGSPLITGNLYANDYATPTPSYLATAIDDTAAAYADAAGREGWTDLGSGELGGRALAPGLYHWEAAVAITTNLILTGGPDDIYIFQIGGALTMAAAIQVTLPNGALPKNIFWQTVGAVALGASAELPGIVLSNAAITLGASAVVNGRLFATTIETLAASVSVLEPAP